MVSKIMKYLTFIWVFFIVGQVFADCPVVSDQAENLITAHTNNVRGGEYCKYRDIVKTKNIEIILYSIEGACYKDTITPKGACGNHFTRYMTGIVNGKEIAPITVGGKGIFYTKNLEINGENIIISGLSYLSTDPMCCPSKKDSHTYIIDSGSFKEVKP
ncbi:MAG: hypothetical protein Q3M24_18505 [Candidatus Electrothrix aestuarii]|uniref:Uncharacterized protein n=1 Tax=Candidatus Electrothrix aestuarii TaxID=3062594 RepID=A0AAU8LRX7_9BACT